MPSRKKKMLMSTVMMMLSNIFLILPVFFAAAYHEWLFLFFAIGIVICSPLFHWYWITRASSVYFILFRVFDWLFAAGGFVCMYSVVSQNIHGALQDVLYIILSSILLFFLYGWRYGNYKKLHPWFHVFAPIVSSIILIAAHSSY